MELVRMALETSRPPSTPSGRAPLQANAYQLAIILFGVLCVGLPSWCRSRRLALVSNVQLVHQHADTAG